jgi:hypothetical protein
MRTVLRLHPGVDDARELAGVLLFTMPERLAHTAAVARAAAELAVTVDPVDRGLLVMAAWLHDVGYSPLLRSTGFHPLDGARYLDRRGWSERLCGLVAHHSGARFVAEVRGLGAQLAGFPAEQSAISDALTYADQTRGVDGAPVSMRQRMDEAVRRHGPASPQALAHPRRAAHLLGVADRVERRLPG